MPLEPTTYCSTSPARLQGLDHYTPPEPAMLVVRCLEDYQLYEILPEPERSAWLLFLAHYLEKVYPDLIDSDLRPQEAAAAQRELADAIAQARFAEGEDDDEDSDDDPDAEDSMYGGSKPASDIPAESATASVENAAESAIEDDPDSYANPLPYSVAAGFPAPAPKALAIAERRMAEADALDAAQPDGPRDYPPGARDKLSPSVTEHPHPERVLRSLIHRLRSGTLPLPSPAPGFEPVNIQLDDEPGIRGIPDVLNEQES